jgi:hypothetical protein
MKTVMIAGAAAIVILLGINIYALTHERTRTIVENHTVTIQKTVDRQANTAHLGLCVSIAYFNGYVQAAEILAPSDSGGVVSCPTGTFTSVVPQTAATGSNDG